MLAPDDQRRGWEGNDIRVLASTDRPDGIIGAVDAP